MKIIRFIILIALIQGCSWNMENPCSLPEEVLTGLNKIDSLINDTILKQRQKGWMTCNYDEAPLFNAEHETFRFRIYCFGSGSYSKIVRITKLDSSYCNVVIKEFKSTTGSPDTKGDIYVFRLPNNDWDELKTIVNSSNFWTTIASDDKFLPHGCGWSIETYNPIMNKCTMKNFHLIGGSYPVDSSLISIYDFFDNINKK